MLPCVYRRKANADVVFVCGQVADFRNSLKRHPSNMRWRRQAWRDQQPNLMMSRQALRKKCLCDEGETPEETGEEYAVSGAWPRLNIEEATAVGAPHTFVSPVGGCCRFLKRRFITVLLRANSSW